MNNIKGPAIFLAQFVGEDEPFNSLDNICKWASSLGYKGVQIPSWDSRLIDLKKASLFGSVPYASCMQYPRTRILHADARVTPTEKFFDVSEDRDY